MSHSFAISGDPPPLREGFVERVLDRVSCTVDHGGAPCGWAHWAHTGEERYAVYAPVPRWLGKLLVTLRGLRR